MTEHEKARAWREKRNLTVKELADLTGYSTVSIFWFERGTTPTRPGKVRYEEIADAVWQRYKTACSGVDARLKLGRKFDW